MKSIASQPQKINMILVIVQSLSVQRSSCFNATRFPRKELE
uniref:Uncharacterized protein n=1 Tax=Rhizophora mucronata TaxID=61149 RepID=A0A2P2NE16_RHIMU